MTPFSMFKKCAFTPKHRNAPRRKRPEPADTEAQGPDMFGAVAHPLPRCRGLNLQVYDNVTAPRVYRVRRLSVRERSARGWLGQALLSAASYNI